MKRRLALLGILSLGFGLRVYHLSHLSVWLDESHSILAAKLPLPQLVQFVAARSHPPLYFLQLHAWIPLGDGEFVVRFLSVLWGLIGIAALYVLARRIAGEGAGLVSALLLSLSPIHVWHSQDARMYTLLFALVALSSYFLLRALAGSRRRYWLLYALFAVLSLYTQNTAIFTLAAQALFVLCYTAARRRWSLLRGWGLAVAVMAVVYLPWLSTAAAQARHLQQYFWISEPTGRSVLDTFDYLSSALLFTRSPWFSDLSAWPASAIYGIYAALLVLGSWQLVRQTRSRALLLALLLAVPIAGEYVASFVRPIYLNRTLLVVAAPLFILYAASVTRSQGRVRLVAAVLLIAGVGCNLASLANMFRNGQKEEWRQAARLVAQESRPGEAIFFDQGIVQVPFDYYYHRYSPLLEEYGYPAEYTRWYQQPQPGQERWWVVDYMNSDPEAAMARLTEIARQHSAVWLIVNRPLSEGRLESWLQKNSDGLEVHQFLWITVYRFENPGGA